jgi:hypothetical protein
MMKSPFTRMLLLSFILCLGIGASAQQHELAVTVGGQFPYNNQFDSGASFAVGGSYAGRLIGVPLAAVYFELPVVVGPKSVLHLPSSSIYSSLFVTPGLKLKLAPEFPVSPFFAAGVGFARFHSDATALTGSDSHTTNVFDFGGGVDMKVLPYLSIRGEVRDFYSGSPALGAIIDTGRQHNVIAQTGLVLRF